MHYFPVISSTLSAIHVSAYLQQQYQLGLHTTCRLIRAAVNHAYLVTDGASKYVFRIYSLNWRTEKEIREEIRLLQLLQENQIPVSFAIPDPQGNYLQTLPAPEGPRWGVLFSYARGEKILGYDAAMHYKIGAIMARIHQVTKDRSLERTTYTPQVLLIDSFEKVKEFLSIETEEMQFMQRAQQYLLQQFDTFDTHALRRGIVHLDIWFDNLHIYNNEEVVIFDFDFCGNGFFALDIAYYQMQVFNVEREPGQYDIKWESFLKGYESVAAVTDEEQRILPIFCISLYFFYLGVQCQRFENWSNSFLNETYLKRYITVVVKRIYQFHHLPE